MALEYSGAFFIALIFKRGGMLMETENAGCGLCRATGKKGGG
jgi:hypothetical protein